MIDKKYQIFISSTYDDLISAREKIIGTILSLYHFPIGMEMFSADDAEQWEVIKETINISDYYLVIIGHRYGTETSEGISFTEKEYDYAKEKNIPILAFIRERDVATKPNERDDDPKKIKKLNRFIEKAIKSKMCDYWKNEDELTTKVAVAITKLFHKNPRVGWVRSDKAISPEVSEELAKLSKENRGLRKENESLLTQLNNKKPELGVTFNENEKELNISIPSNENMAITFKGGKSLPISFEEHPKPIDYEQVPSHLHAYITENDIEKYNLSLPKNKEIDDYNEQLEYYWRTQETSQDLSINIFNSGTAKANEIFIEIEFPEEITVMEKDKISKIDLPENLIPEDPISKAQKKYNENQKKKNMPWALDMRDHNDFKIPYTSHIPNIHDTLSDMLADIKQDFQIDLFENKITIRMNSLLQTMQKNFGNYQIIPLKSGTFEVKVSIICEEYPEQQEYFFPINILNKL